MNLREPWAKFETVWRECDMCGEGEMWAEFGATDRAHHACEHHRWITILPCDEHGDEDQ